MNRDTHELRALTDLTQQQRESGDWIAEHEATRERLLGLLTREEPRDAVAEQRVLERRFARRPTIPGAPGSPDRRGSFDALGRPRW